MLLCDQAVVNWWVNLALCNLVFAILDYEYIVRWITLPANNIAEIVLLLLKQKHKFNKLVLRYIFKIGNFSKKINHFLSVPLVDFRKNRLVVILSHCGELAWLDASNSGRSLGNFVWIFLVHLQSQLAKGPTRADVRNWHHVLIFFFVF